MIDSLLVANRGEVAGRIIATCRRLGIRTVAVFSDADRHSLPVRLADEAIYLGPSPPAESYLNIGALLRAAERGEAGAVHPGYGFLAENADFARRVRESGRVFVGPPTEVIDTLGSKVAARELCRRVGVPTVPGSPALEDEGLLEWAARCGYPVMLKASAGGGGKGMRRLHDAEELLSSLPSARREAAKAFGCDELYLEKALVRPRHLEVQVAGDGSSVIHLGVRECSLQRRHQKLIEESPPTNVSPDLLTALTEAAVRLAEAVNYSSLGTVEFLVEGADFYFLEMNTRLQVEHPVTEMVTGLDLVELQIRLAEGAELPFGQEEVTFRGHAVEARICCEDADHGFSPATGTVLDWRPSPRIRCDSVLERGTEIGPDYDPMVAKLIAWGEDRNKALRLLKAGLRETVLLGVRQNIDLLRSLLALPEVERGEQHTELVETLGLGRSAAGREQILAATAFRRAELVGTLSEGRSTADWGQLPTATAFRRAELVGTPSGASAFPLVLQFQGYPEVRVAGQLFSLEGETSRVEVFPGAVEIDGRRLPVAGARREESWWLHTPEGTVCFESVPRFPLPEAASSSAGGLTAPMPGNVVEVLVEVGDRVEAGQTLLKLEAMKMEQVLAATTSGVVAELHCGAGDQVDAGAVLVVVQPAPAPA